MEGRNTSSFTEQGYGSPATVGRASCRAGSHRPSSSDRGAPLVGNQAGVSQNASGTQQGGEEEDYAAVFGKRDSIGRSPQGPPQRTGKKYLFSGTSESSADDHDITIVEATKSETSTPRNKDPAGDSFRLQRKPKRKRLATPPHQAIGQQDPLCDVLKSLEIVTEQQRWLASLVKQNTRVEIKTAIKDLDGAVKLLGRKINALSEVPLPKPRGVGLKETSEAATQTTVGDKRLRREVDAIRAWLDDRKRDGSSTAILDKEWPEEVFKRTKDIDKASDEELDRSDTAVVVDPGCATLTPEVRKLTGCSREEELKVLASLKDGDMEQTYRYVKVNVRGHSTIRQEKNTYFLPMAKGKEKGAAIESFADLLGQLSSAANISGPGKDIKVLYDVKMGIDDALGRKLLEAAFAHSEGNVLCKVVKPLTMSARNPRRPRKQEVAYVTVDAEGTTYADLLKKIKAEVNVKDLGVDVKAIRKTGKGEVRFTVKGEAEKANRLRNAIQEKVANRRIETRGNEGSIFILGLDEVTTMDEVKMAIAEAGGINIDRVKIIRNGVNARGVGTALAEVPKDTARVLADKGTLSVGWIECSVRERVAVPRCYKCLEFGHIAKSCKSERSRAGSCLKCGETGHIAKECSNKLQCFVCGVAGHRADQMACPKYKKLIEDLRRRRVKESRRTAGTRSDRSLAEREEGEETDLCTTEEEGGAQGYTTEDEGKVQEESAGETMETVAAVAVTLTKRSRPRTMST